MRSIVVLVFALVAMGGSVAATTVDISYSHRQIPSGPEPDPDMVEASIVVTYTADEPIELATPDTSMVRLDDRTFQHTFVWNWDGPKHAVFVDGDGTEIPTVAWPQPVYALRPELWDFPIMHIRTDSTGLWDPEVGIYVWGNHENFMQHGEEWERGTIVDFYEHGGPPAFSDSAGVRIHGAWGRRNDQKSLRLYFDDYGDDDDLDHDFYGEGPTVFQRLLLRQCATPTYALNSILLEEIFRDLGYLGSRTTPVVAFLNHEYWGLYNLRERWDSKFFEDTHELADAGAYELVVNGITEEGDADAWPSFQATFLDVDDPSSHAWYTGVTSQLDLDSYIDWLLINIFVAPRDNGGPRNVVVYRIGSGRWTYGMWDEDSTFVTPNLEYDYFRFFSADTIEEFEALMPPAYGQTNWERQRPWFTMFDRFMQNSEFKARFSARADELLAGVLSPETLIGRLDALIGVQSPEIERHFERWSGATYWNYCWHGDQLRNFINARHAIVTAQKEAFMEFYRVPVELSAFQVRTVDDEVVLTWRTESQSDNQGFEVYRSIGTPDQMQLLASYVDHAELEGQADSLEPMDYIFVDDSAEQGPIYYYQLHHIDGMGGDTAHSWVESTAPPSWASVVINEFMASNDATIADEFGEYDDWVELYNNGDQLAELGGLYLSDDPGEPTHWRLPDITLAPGEHLLIWCDDDPEQGPLHTSFKLSADGEDIVLFADEDHGHAVIDHRAFEEQTPDVSEGRRFDGATSWISFLEPSPGTPNLDPIGAPLPQADLVWLGPNRPNPFNPSTRFEFVIPAAGPVSLRVYDLRGQRVATLVHADLPAGRHHATWHGRDDRGAPAASGSYVARLEADGHVQQRRIALVK